MCQDHTDRPDLDHCGKCWQEFEAWAETKADMFGL